jgi:hypothetical protein
MKQLMEVPEIAAILLRMWLDFLSPSAAETQKILTIVRPTQVFALMMFLVRALPSARGHDKNLE